MELKVLDAVVFEFGINTFFKLRKGYVATRTAQG